MVSISSKQKLLGFMVITENGRQWTIEVKHGTKNLIVRFVESQHIPYVYI